MRLPFSWIVASIALAGAVAAHAALPQEGGEVADVVMRTTPRGLFQVVLRCNHGRYVITGATGSLAHSAYTASARPGTLFFVEHHDSRGPGHATQFQRIDALVP